MGGVYANVSLGVPNYKTYYCCSPQSLRAKTVSAIHSAGGSATHQAVGSFGRITQSASDSFYTVIDNSYVGIRTQNLTVKKATRGIDLYVTLHFSVFPSGTSRARNNIGAPQVDSVVLARQPNIVTSWHADALRNISGHRKPAVRRLYGLFHNDTLPIAISVVNRPAGRDTAHLGESTVGTTETENIEYLTVQFMPPFDPDSVIRDNFILVRKLTYHEETCLLDTSRVKRNSELVEQAVRMYSPENPSIADIAKKTTVLNRQDSITVNTMVRRVNPSEVSDYVYFSGISTITVSYNDIVSRSSDENTSPSRQYYKTLVHEMGHISWSYINQFSNLRWYVARSRILETPYKLGDDLGKNHPIGTTDGCSVGSGHERNNPENIYVCNLIR
jgi:hypothetical protein